ncbi:MAG: hypothetical protein BM565_12680 [Gammaproteobacteria bacterium MedPE]|nr:MAG: hypothetical protein BM565_12680 [Gammaproteobacteria bacterium MedPE]
MKFLLLSLLIAFSANATDIYRWTDSKGVTHYSYKEPSNVPANKVKKIDMTKQGRYVTESKNKSDEKLSEQELELDRIAKKNCDIAQKNIQILTTFNNIQQKDANGKLQTLTKDDKTQQLSLAKKQAAMFCKSDKKQS